MIHDTYRYIEDKLGRMSGQVRLKLDIVAVTRPNHQGVYTPGCLGNILKLTCHIHMPRGAPACPEP
mgnify:CR=1 FL=1